MAPRVQKRERAAGVQVDGLREALLALNRYSKEVGKEARDELRDGAKVIQTRARSIDSGSPAEASRKTWIGRSVTSKGAAITLRASAFPRALSTEFGAKTHTVYGQKRPVRYMRRGAFTDWRGNRPELERGSDGRVIQRAIRELLPRVTRDIAEGLDRLLERELNRAKVPKRGKAGR